MSTNQCRKEVKAVLLNDWGRTVGLGSVVALIMIGVISLCVIAHAIFH